MKKKKPKLGPDQGSQETVREYMERITELPVPHTLAEYGEYCVIFLLMRRIKAGMTPEEAKVHATNSVLSIYPPHWKAELAPHLERMLGRKLLETEIQDGMLYS